MVIRKQPPFGGCFFVYSRPLPPLHSARLLDLIFIFLFRIFYTLELIMFQPHHTTMLRVVRVVTIALLIWLFALPLFVSALTVSIVQMPLLLLTVLSVLIPLFPRFKEWRTQPEVLLPRGRLSAPTSFSASAGRSPFMSHQMFTSSGFCWKCSLAVPCAGTCTTAC